MEQRKRSEHMSDIYKLVLSMGTFVKEALEKALHALVNRNLQLAQQIIDSDDHIDEYRNTIEDACTKLIATKQPVASALRELIAIIKVAGDLERIGDHARHLATTIRAVRDPLLERVLPQLQRMTETGIQMVTQALSAFAEQNTERAALVAQEDDRMDEQCHTLQSTIVEIMKESPDNIEGGTQLLMLNRFLERLGDHVTNICEWIVYAQRGTHIALNR